MIKKTENEIEIMNIIANNEALTNFKSMIFIQYAMNDNEKMSRQGSQIFQDFFS